MSNIANPKSTEGGIAGAFSRQGVATTVAALLFAIAIVSFRPFQPAGADTVGGGDLVNQLGFGSLGAASIIALATLADRRVLPALFSPSFLLLIGFMLFSVSYAPDFGGAVRAASFTLIGILVMATVLAVSRDADALSTVIAFAGFVVVGLSYAGLLLFPNEAMHIAASSEPQHAGLWRGVFAHKNIAGPVMACFSFAGLYLFRRGWRTSGVILLVAAMVFMLNTGSKTTVGLVPLVILMVAAPGIMGLRIVTTVVFLVAIAGTAVGTLGIVFIEPVKRLAGQIAPDLTYTGRTTLWEFAGEMIAKRPWSGYGYDSFWGSPLVTGSDNPFDRPWDVRTMMHGHDGYLDIAVTMGIPALCVAAYVFFIAPLRDYMRIPLRKENIFLGDFFMMTLLFTALNSFLESFFFRRADPVWLLLVFSLIGLRLAARFELPSGHRRS